MEVKKFIENLEKEKLILKENFTVTLKKKIKKYQEENKIKNLDEVYKLIGIRKEYLHYWEKHPTSSQQKKL